MKSSSLAVFFLLCVLACCSWQHAHAWTHHVCGRDLVDLVGLVCSNRYYSDLSKRPQLSPKHRRDASGGEAPFSSERDAKRFHRSSSSSRRRTGLIVTECCENSCDFATVESYCAYPLPGVALDQERNQIEREIVAQHSKSRGGNNSNRKKPSSSDPFSSRHRPKSVVAKPKAATTVRPPAEAPPTTETTTKRDSSTAKSEQDTQEDTKQKSLTPIVPTPFRPRPSTMAMKRKLVTNNYEQKSSDPRKEIPTKKINLSKASRHYSKKKISEMEEGLDFSNNNQKEPIQTDPADTLLDIY